MIPIHLTAIYLNSSAYKDRFSILLLRSQRPRTAAKTIRTFQHTHSRRRKVVTSVKLALVPYAKNTLRDVVTD